MKKITLWLLCFCMATTFGFAQTFTDGVVHDIQNGNGGTDATCGTIDELTLPLTVSGVGTLDASSNVLQSVTFNATHTWNADITVSLQDPSGAITVLLIDSIGSSGDGFTDCILDDSASETLPTSFTSPVTGTFLPLEALAGFNGLSADGDWSLIVCDSADGDIGTVDSWSLTFGPPPPPANDDCVNAIALDCVNNTASGSNSSSVDSEVWFSFTGTVVDDPITASLCGSGFDTIITIYDACDGTEIATNDDSCGLQSEVTFTSDGVTTYLISIQGFDAESGDYNLTLECASENIPDNDDCLSAEAIGCNDTVTGETTFASDSDLNGSLDVWYSYTGTVVDDNITASLCGSSFDTVITIYDACDGAEVATNDDFCGLQSEVSWLSDGLTTYLIRVEGFNTSAGDYQLSLICDSETPPANDECVNAETIVCGGQYIGDTTFASSEGDDDPGECGTTAGSGGAVWYTFVGANSNNAGAAAGTEGDEVTLDLSLSTFDTKIRVFTGVCGDLTCLDGDDDGGDGTTSLITFPTTVGTEYYVLVHGFLDNAGEYTLDVSCVAPPTCTAAVIDSATEVEDTCNPDGTGTYVVEIEVTNAGDAGSVFDDGTNTYPVVAGTVTAGPYDSGEEVTIELVALDSDCSFTVGTFEFTCPEPAPENDNLEDAIPIVCGGTYTGDTTLATIDEEDAPDIATVEEDTDADTDSPNVWYSFVGTGDVVTLSTCGTGSFDTEIFVFTGSSGALTCIDDGYDECGSSDGFAAETSFTSVAGTQYWISIEGWNPTTVGAFGLSVTCTPPPSCIPAEFTLSNGGNTCPSDGGFVIDVDISSLGTATTVNILQDGVAVYSGVDLSGSPYSVGGLTSATDYDITIEDAADDTCFSTQQYSTDVCPPVNDDIAGAINLEVGDTVCEDLYTGTNVGATDSGETFPECGTSSFGGDVWFKLTVPSSGEVTIETSEAAVNPIFDTVIEVFTGSPGNLTQIDCDDEGGVDSFSLLELTGLTPGDVLLIRVWEWQDNSKGNFNICAWSPSSLGVDDTTFDGFTYYPNPIKDVLTLESARTIDKIEVFNVLGQRIVAIDSQNTIQNIDMSNVQAGAYFVKVSIENQIKTIRVIKE
ncbi:T9SS type A sorting domain-containing protein [Psychroserpens sp. SPM9]|uniref:T9SS type A sorting domain-containing protein n=1 Tax=Psychroserpens sp. SPM9 TaxID=2975598 RepID=UPI0021A5F432|nr:T9SS type A sorting domain-containing protein [Psychroserpens sp. SPM9]MDG5491715.1 T9SS type A sorting domain-containing protein [Psychroserpens sp. SPM9]